MPETRPRTVAAVQEQAAYAASVLDRLIPLTEYTIADYPIGRSDRGQCRLQVERKGLQARTVRTTTNKRGRWCNPKKSTYQQLTIVVVKDPGDSQLRKAAWLKLGLFEGIYLTHANSATTLLIEAPNWCAPHREPRHHTLVTRPLFGSESLAEKTQHTIPADPPELCDAWDTWTKTFPLLAERFVRFAAGTLTTIPAGVS